MHVFFRGSEKFLIQSHVYLQEWSLGLSYYIADKTAAKIVTKKGYLQSPFMHEYLLGED